MNILVNSVIEWFYEDIDDRSPIFEKVLWIEPGSISDSTHNTVVVINLLDEKAIPFTRSIREITEAADIGLLRLLESDPYGIKLIQEEHIEPKHRKRRDERYSIISEIIELEGVHGYLPEDRGRIIRRAVAEGVSSRKSIYQLLRLWWKGGQNRNALLPRFDKCGHPGKRRTGSSSSDTKLGKPSNASKSSGKRIGVRITARDEIKFAKGTRRFYEGRKSKSLVKAYRQILFAYYNIGYEKKDGVLVPTLPPAAQLPTLDQFRYWYNSVFCDPVRRVKKRRGETRFNLQYRAITGDATSIAFGPGSVYQIDATIADVYLVSHYFGLKIIGRPVIYVVIDVFSRMIVGVAVLMEGPSWYGAMLALDNVLEDKVEYCKRFGITIEECDWPVREFPAVIMADRGEFEGYNVENLINVFGVTVQNTAPYRADWKSIVERHFGIATEKFIKFVPGGVEKKRERGDRDPRLDAVFTLREFEELVLNHVVDYNRAHYLEYYRKDEFMISDEVPRFPIDLWNWGRENRNGHLRTVDRDLARMNLLPRKEVSVTPKGIRFSHNMFYTCETARNENWFAQARMGKRRRISVAYHPHSTEHVYFPGRDGKSVEVCELTDGSKGSYLQSDFYSVEDYFFKEAIDAENSVDRQLRSDAEFQARLDHVTTKAAKRKSEALRQVDELSAAAQISNIQTNRAKEREEARRENIWPIGSDKEAAILDQKTLSESAASSKDKSYATAPDYTARLAHNFSKRKIQDLESEEVN